MRTCLRRMSGPAVVALLASALSAGLAGCAQPVSGPELVLTLAAPASWSEEDTSLQVQHFVQGVHQRSGGSIRVDIVANTYATARDPDDAVADGVVHGYWDLGLVPGRTWDELGVMTLRALNAPFLIVSPAALEAVLDDDVRGDLLAGLPAAGVVGLDIFPDGMRHPFSYHKPLLVPADYGRGSIRASGSKTVAALFGALGAPVTPMHADTVDQVGAESQFSVVPDGLTTATGNVTFYPKTDTLVAGTALRDRLRDDQWRLLVTAAAATRAWLFSQQPSDFEEAASFCDDGGKIVAATDAQVDLVEKAAQPVTDALVADTGTRRLVDRIRILTQGLPAPEPVTQCPGTDATEGAAGELSSLDGLYKSRVTARAMHAAGVTDIGLVRENTGRFTWILDNGTYTIHTEANHLVSNPDGTGRYTLKRGLFTLHWSTEPGDWTQTQVRVAPDGTITFRAVRDGASGFQDEAEAFFSAPWVRIGAVPR